MTRKQRKRAAELLLDVVGIATAWHATVHLRVLLNPQMTIQMTAQEVAAAAPPLGGVTLLWLAAEMWRRNTRQTPAAERLVSFGESVAMVGLLTAVVAFFSRQFGADLSRSFVLLFLPVSFAAMIWARYTALTLASALDRHWPIPQRVALLGLGEEAETIASRMKSGPEKFTLAGYILPREAEPVGVGPVLGRVDRLAEVINASALDRIVLVRSGVSDREFEDCRSTSRRMGVTFTQVVAEPSAPVRLKLERLCGVPVLDATPVPFARVQEAVKRSVDVVGASVLLALLSPAMLALAALVRLTSEGPALYCSRRVGRGGRHFTFLKFRSMYQASSGKRQLAGANEKSGHIFKIRNDSRVTPVGRFMRRYSLDELPQLINVLQGDMSLVGPRPLPAEDLDPDGQSRLFAEWSELRSLAAPGLTGLWQVRGRSEVSFEEMVRLDIAYVQGWSLVVDIRILLATPLAVLTGRGAY